MNRWKEFLHSPAVFDLKLPAKVEAVRWDLILVDEPTGWHETAPRPRQNESIAAASRLAGNAGDVFVHGGNRLVEEVFLATHV